MYRHAALLGSYSAGLGIASNPSTLTFTTTKKALMPNGDQSKYR